MLLESQVVTNAQMDTFTHIQCLHLHTECYISAAVWNMEINQLLHNIQLEKTSTFYHTVQIYKSIQHMEPSAVML